MLHRVEQRLISENVDVLDEFEQALLREGLTFTRMSLKKYKPCCHWHIKKPGEKGTLEATYLLDSHLLWLEIRPGRDAPWQDLVVTRLELLFADEFRDPL
jgi:hypothetical protein